MQYGCFETRFFRKLRIGVQRIVIAVQPIEQRRLSRCGYIDHGIRLAVWQCMRYWTGGYRATKAAVATGKYGGALGIE